MSVIVLKFPCMTYKEVDLNIQNYYDLGYAQAILSKMQPNSGFIFFRLF